MIMGLRGPQSVHVESLKFWEQQWERFFRYLKDGVRGYETEVPDPDYFKLKAEQVGLNHYKIGPVKPLGPLEPTGSLRFGPNGRLRRRWSEVPGAERRKVSFPFEFVTLTQPSLPPEPTTIEGLLSARTAKQVRTLCKRSRYWQPLRPDRCTFLAQIQSAQERGRAIQRFTNLAGFLFPRLENLYKYAEQFIAAKESLRFPHSSRPSSKDKQLNFLAGAMAGVTMKRHARTALDLLKKSTRRGKKLRRSRDAVVPESQ